MTSSLHRPRKPARSARPIPWGQRVARQQEMRERGVHYACRFRHLGDSIEAILTIPGEAEHVPDRRGVGDSPADAILQALRCDGLTFRTERDEQDACLAALRGKVLRIEREERQLTSLGLL
jgi:hypothetical protein